MHRVDDFEKRLSRSNTEYKTTMRDTEFIKTLGTTRLVDLCACRIVILCCDKIWNVTRSHC
jgi:hypothetical protein